MTKPCSSLQNIVPITEPFQEYSWLSRCISVYRADSEWLVLSDYSAVWAKVCGRLEARPKIEQIYSTMPLRGSGWGTINLPRNVYYVYQCAKDTLGKFSVEFLWQQTAQLYNSFHGPCGMNLPYGPGHMADPNGSAIWIWLIMKDSDDRQEIETSGICRLQLHYLIDGAIVDLLVLKLVLPSSTVNVVFVESTVAIASQL